MIRFGFLLAILFGIYSYLIFFLGIFGILTKANIWIITPIWFTLLLLAERNFLFTLLDRLKKIPFSITNCKKSRVIYFFLTILILQALVNLIGVLGPELAFDALWYHLTLPKLYLLHTMIYHIPGGLLYYSDMPKLGEMIYVGALGFGNEILAKLIHYFFGLLIAVAIYKISLKFFNQTVALLVVVIFYSNLVIDWESITAYIDLIRSFFEFLSLWGLLNWYESQKSTRLVVSGIMIGLAITTKLLAIGSFFILLALLIAIAVIKSKSIKEILSGSLIFFFCCFIIPMPWFIFTYLHTGNPVYPFFTQIYEVTPSSPSFLNIIQDLWTLFIHAADPISPIYLMFLPLLFVFYSKMRKEIKVIIWYSGLSIILWYFTPRTGGGRFIVPYLPAFSIICGALYSEILKRTGKEWKYLRKFLVIISIFVAILSIGYRAFANNRYIPVILGKETEREFLSKNLNFHFGDFYDTDGYFASHIRQTDAVLLYGFHNLYYVNFNFIDVSWVKKGDQFNYIATQNTKLPPKYANWQLIYYNDKTMVQLYKPPNGECLKLCQF